MINFERNSVILREFLMSSYGKFFPGCVFYITKYGLPFADGSFGWARMPGSPEGESPMTKKTLMNTGSTGKVFGALAIIKMVEEWNEMHTQLQSVPNYTPPYPAEIPFRNFVKSFAASITLDTPFWPLIQPLSSDDGSLLWIDDDLLIDFNSSHGLESRESARVFLFAAETYYPIRVEWFNDEGGGQLYLAWMLPNSTAYEAIPPENFLAG